MTDEPKTEPAPETAPEPAAEKSPAPRSPLGRLRRAVFFCFLGALGPLAIGVGGVSVYLAGGRFVSTDNAYVKAEKIAVSTDVPGRVVHVAVRDNQILNAGELLFRIDPEPFKITLARTEADLAAARQEIAALRALYRQKQAQLKQARGERDFYRKKFERQQTLNKKGYASESKLDDAQRSLRMASDDIAALEQDLGRVRAQLAGKPQMDVDKYPQVLAALAARDAAALDLRRTEVRAPGPGIVTNFDLQLGEYIEAGKPVFSLVGTESVWVRANFKETDLTHVTVGQEATIKFDTYPDQPTRAVVASISPATGAEFAVLPAQNASGNWVKVVQRLPVRLELTGAAGGPALRAGMSATVEIDTGHERNLPGVVATAWAWVTNHR